MYQASSAAFLYAVSPVHMGAGTALGVIDNPIQRERHTGHPMAAGSGIKGALRHAANALEGWSKDDVKRLFGPGPGTDGSASDHAGAISFGDAQLVLFPVRSLRRGYVYATCPTALGRARRVLLEAGASDAQGWSIPEPTREACAAANSDLLDPEGHVVLEAFRFRVDESFEGDVRELAEGLAQDAVPEGTAHDYFRGKVERDLVVLSDERFGYFVKNATVVEPHVRINDASGTASDGGLFYTESLPPESLMLAPVFASRSRVKDEGHLEADAVLEQLVRGPKGSGGLDGRMVQIGGDASTGRGQVALRFVRGG